MKVFLSWSGSRSKAVADAFFTWLPQVLHSVDPWMSSEIDKGRKWGGEISKQLEDTSFGIICLTKDNLNKPWINFEAGALSKTTNALVWTFLLDLSPADVDQPLGQFQHTLNNKDDIRKLVWTISDVVRQLGEKAPTATVLTKSFEMFWPELRDAFQAVPSVESHNPNAAPPLTDRAILEELLEIARRQTGRDVATTVVEAPETRILFLAAQPEISPVDFERELSRIETGIRLGTKRDRLSFRTLWASSIDRLVQAMLDETPTIVHFSGGGSTSAIVLRSDTGEKQPIDADTLEQLFSLFSGPVRCLVLSRCFSEGLARVLRRQIPAVVGSIPAISRDVDAVFWSGFYNAIASGKDPHFAFEMGKARVVADGFAAAHGFYLL